jgi:hypothetical protein
LKAKIEDNRSRGRVIIEYSTLQDFDLLLQSLSGRSGQASGCPVVSPFEIT